MITRRITVTMMVVAICAIGCKEEESVQPMQQQSVNQKTTNTIDKRAHNRFYYDDGGDRFGCTTMAYGNCLDDIIVNAPSEPLLGDFIINIQGGNQEVIQNVCLNKYDLLKEFIPANLLDASIAGKLTISHKANTTNGVQTDYLLFHNLNSQLEAVVPLKF